MRKIVLALMMSSLILASGFGNTAFAGQKSESAVAALLAALVQSPQEQRFTPKSNDRQLAEDRIRCPAVTGDYCDASDKACCLINGEYKCKRKLSDCVE
jgi:hypothetical protein